MVLEIYNWVTGRQEVKPNFLEQPNNFVPDPA
jgi:hypothetical protein